MADAVVTRLEAAIARLEAVTSRLGSGGRGGSDEKVHPSVEAYRDYYQQFVAPFIATCQKLQNAHKIAERTEKAFGELGKVVEAASQCKQPSVAELMSFAKGIVDVVNESQNCDNRDPFFNHYKAYAEMIQLMNWISAPGPAAVVSATLEAADFYLNKVLVFGKDKPDAEKQAHRDFVAQSKALITNLADYCKEFHKMGLSWNVNGKPLSQFSSSGGAAAAAEVPSAPPAAPGGLDDFGPPPPPPCDPNVKLDLTASEPAKPEPTKAKVGGMAAVFEEIQKKRDAAAAGLKHVTKEMKTKNQTDRPAGVVPDKPSAAGAAKVEKPKEEVKKPASLTRKQGTWFCENYENEGSVVIDGVAMKESVYIYKCHSSFIHVKGKVKSIQLDGCSKVTVVCDAVVSTFEVVNSKRVTCQIVQNAPSVVLDKSSGVHIHLTKESYENPPTIVSSMSTEMNVSIPGPDGSDPIEQPIAEQFQTVFKDGKLVTEPVAHSAA